MNIFLEKFIVYVKCECFICYEMGEFCGVGRFCRDFFDIIFSFQVFINVCYLYVKLLNFGIMLFIEKSFVY